MATMEPLQNTLVFIIETAFSLYIMIVLLRFLLQLARADFYNPVSQFIVKATNPILIPLRKFIPGLMGIDLASIVLLILLQCIEFIVLLLIKGQSIAMSPLGILGLCVISFGTLLNLALNIYLFLIFILVILSWIQPPGGYNPFINLIAQLTNPILIPLRHRIPAIGGLDLSPMVAMALLYIGKILIVQYTLILGYGLM